MSGPKKKKPKQFFHKRINQSQYLLQRRAKPFFKGTLTTHKQTFSSRLFSLPLSLSLCFSLCLSELLSLCFSFSLSLSLCFFSECSLCSLEHRRYKRQRSSMRGQARSRRRRCHHFKKNKKKTTKQAPSMHTLSFLSLRHSREWAV